MTIMTIVQQGSPCATQNVTNSQNHMNELREIINCLRVVQTQSTLLDERKEVLNPIIQTLQTELNSRKLTDKMKNALSSAKNILESVCGLVTAVGTLIAKLIHFCSGSNSSFWD